MSNEVHELEGVGEFRAKPGTAISELAGAAKYWSDRAKAAENALSTRQWSYFTAGCIFAGLVGLGIRAAITLF